MTLGLHDERAGDDDALALPAGQLVRVAEREVGGRSKARASEGLAGPAVALGASMPMPVDDERLGHEVADRLLRVQRLVRVLEDELDPPPVVPQLACAPQVADVLPVEGDPPARLAASA